MKNYDIFLFDADDTLYDFNKSEANALMTVFNNCALDFTEDILMIYREINAEIWAGYDKGEISKEDLQTMRFSRLFHILGVKRDEADFNRQYLAELGRGAFLINGAMEICKEIVFRGKAIFIVSNGILATQEARLRQSLIKKYISGFFVSEIVGFKKPEVEFFEYVFSHIPQVGKDKILLVGDSLSSDIAGGNKVGIDTCWLNIGMRENDTDNKPTYEISGLRELLNII